mmetsp:Transcript_47996/g.80612  ORF Transcript_47996/g.80612 Transcript_47996/m.80612 type:complete len:302 (-) Transcript_47996:1678-2583(-)
MIVHRYINKYHVTQAPTSATTAPPPHPSRPRTLYCTFCATHEAICSALASLLQPHPPSFSVSRPDLTSRLQVGLSQHWHCPRPSTVVATWLRNSAFKEQLSGQKADDATGSRSSAPMNHTPAAGAQGLSLIGRSMACGHRDKSDAACMRRAAPPTPETHAPNPWATDHLKIAITASTFSFTASPYAERAPLRGTSRSARAFCTASVSFRRSRMLQALRTSCCPSFGSNFWSTPANVPTMPLSTSPLKASPSGSAARRATAPLFRTGSWCFFMAASTPLRTPGDWIFFLASSISVASRPSSP